VLAAACEAIVPGERTEDPVLSVRGMLVGLDDRPVRVGVLWVDPAGEADDWPSPRDLTVSETDAAGTFHIDFLRPPSERAIRRVLSPTSGTTAFAFAVAEFVAYEDAAGDGFQVTSRTAGSTIVGPDVYRGFGGDYLVVYVDQPRVETSNVIAELHDVLRLRRGYYLVKAYCTMMMRGMLAVVPDSEPAIAITLIPPTDVFPANRVCLNTHPPPSNP
jgi:hypothetical protein